MGLQQTLKPQQAKKKWEKLKKNTPGPSGTAPDREEEEDDDDDDEEEDWGGSQPGLSSRRRKRKREGELLNLIKDIHLIGEYAAAEGGQGEMRKGDQREDGEAVHSPRADD